MAKQNITVTMEEETLKHFEHLAKANQRSRNFVLNAALVHTKELPDSQRTLFVERIGGKE